MPEGKYTGLQEYVSDINNDTEQILPDNEENIRIRRDVDVNDTGGDTTWVYFKDLGRFKILTREQEVTVARRIEKNKKSIKEVIFSSLAVLDKLIECQDKLINKEIRLEDVVSPETCRWFAPENIKREKSKVLSRLKKINKIVNESKNPLHETSSKILIKQLLERFH